MILRYKLFRPIVPYRWPILYKSKNFGLLWQFVERFVEWVPVIRFSDFWRLYLSGGYLYQTFLSVPYVRPFFEKVNRVYLIKDFFQIHIQNFCSLLPNLYSLYLRETPSCTILGATTFTLEQTVLYLFIKIWRSNEFDL